MDALVRARALLDAYDGELRRDLPDGIDLFDAHTHLGNDIDGMVGSYDELTSVLDRYGFQRAFMRFAFAYSMPSCPRRAPARRPMQRSQRTPLTLRVALAITPMLAGGPRSA